ncbi:MAG: transcriptional regulator [Hyphomicrobiales bacterium]|nr:MAG: transcriptional regulator [Hyphomicrobiales bacterium]
MRNLDQIDRKILRLIQVRADMSLDELAAQVALSRNACWRRIKQMEEAGVIRGRVTLLEPEAVGLGLSVFVMIRTSSHEKNWLEKFKKTVQSMPEIVGAHRMSGELDYVLRVRVADMKSYDRFYQQLIAKVSIADISASFVMDDIKDTTVLPV